MTERTWFSPLLRTVPSIRLVRSSNLGSGSRERVCLVVELAELVELVELVEVGRVSLLIIIPLLHVQLITRL